MSRRTVTLVLVVVLITACLLWLTRAPARRAHSVVQDATRRPGRSLALPTASTAPSEAPSRTNHDGPGTEQTLAQPPIRLAQAEAFLDDAMHESGLVSALMGCPLPELEVPAEADASVCAEATIDLYFGPEGLIDARLLDDEHAEYADATLDCYREVLWEVAWPSFEGALMFAGSWKLACLQRMSDAHWQSWSEHIVDSGADPRTAPLPVMLQHVRGPDEPPLEVRYVAPAWVDRE